MTTPGKYKMGELLEAFNGEELIVVLCHPGASTGERSESRLAGLSPAESEEKVHYDGDHIRTQRGGRALYDVFRDLGPK